jgi:predicted TIM-barrel fold metal-dependent hydrolase
MKLICIEEHAFDDALTRSAQPSVDREAPYLAHLGAPTAATETSSTGGPRILSMRDAVNLGRELGPDRISAMDQSGVDVQVVSYSTPSQLGPAETAAALTSAANDRLAAAVEASAGRLAAFAALPWQTPAEAADELTRCVESLGMTGALLMGRPGATFLDDPRYEPVLERFSALGVPLYLHPYYPVLDVQRAYYDGFSPSVSATFSLGGWGWHHEAGIHVLRMILSGVFERHRGLQVISGHWGEMVPFYLSRLDTAMPRSMTGLSAPISDIYRQHVWVTPSGLLDQAQFEFIFRTVGPDRIIWSADYPYLTMDGNRSFLDDLRIPEEDKRKITHENAESLLRL